MVLGPSPATAGFLPMAGRLCYATAGKDGARPSGGMGVGRWTESGVMDMLGMDAVDGREGVDAGENADGWMDVLSLGVTRWWGVGPWWWD